MGLYWFLPWRHSFMNNTGKSKVRIFRKTFFNNSKWNRYKNCRKLLIDQAHVSHGVVGTSTQQTHYTSPVAWSIKLKTFFKIFQIPYSLRSAVWVIHLAIKLKKKRKINKDFGWKSDMLFGKIQVQVNIIPQLQTLLTKSQLYTKILFIDLNWSFIDPFDRYCVDMESPLWD